MPAPSPPTASTVPDVAKCWASKGSSKAPGTQANATLARSTEQAARPSRAPSISRRVIPPLKRAAAMAICSPRPSVVPTSWTPTARDSSSTAPSGRALSSLEIIETFEQVTHPLALGAQVGDVLRVRLGLEGHALDDVEAEPLEPTALGRVVGHEAHRRHAEVDQHLGADPVLAAVGRVAEGQVG